MVLSGEIIGVVVGGALAIVSGTLITYVIKLLDEKKIKKNATRALLAEVYVNQKRLKTNVTFFKNLSTFTVLPEIVFLRDIYSTYFLDKIGLLDPTCGEKVIHYYAFLGGDLLESLKSLSQGLSPNWLKGILLSEKLEEVYKVGEELIKCLDTRSKFFRFFCKIKSLNRLGAFKALWKGR